MSEQKLANQLEALLDEELAARGRTTAILNEQIQALQDKDLDAFTERSERMERELSSNAERGGRRARIVALLAAQWNIAPTALTLASIGRRLGDVGERVLAKREALREAVAEELWANRRLGVLMGAERRLVRALLRTIYGEDVERSLDGAGTLVDAEA
ncbi:MAG: hypothetical protein MK291_05165 [Planctomycetes bacterium]|nr:hypothetical protein [Planctomycetota bacterium]